MTQRAAVRRSAGKLRKLDPSNTSYSGALKRRAQKAAVTRAGNKLAAGKVTGRRTMALKPAAGILKRLKERQPVKGKETDQQPPKATRAPRGTGKPRNKSGKKVDVQIRRAAAGGEYGPDGHFYPAGSWMPAGKFVGAKPKPGSKDFVEKGKKEGEGGERGAKVIRQKQPDPPIVRPSGKSIDAPSNISAKGDTNRGKMFNDGGYLSVTQERRGGQRLSGFNGPGAGIVHYAAVASRMTARQMSEAILKLRKAAKDKAAFDDNMNYERNAYSSGKAYQENQGASDKMWYGRMKREGLLPRNTRPGQFVRARQLFDAVSQAAAQRAARPRNRRNYTEEFAWVFNNLLGSRATRKPGRMPAVTAGAKGAPRRARLTGIGAGYAFRPVSTNRLIAAGGSRWQKGGMDRIYFNGMRDAKIYFDRGARKMDVKASGDESKARAEAKRIERRGRRPIPRRTRIPRRRSDRET